MAGINRRVSGSEQREQGWLLSLQVKDRLAVTVVVTSSRLRYHALRGLRRSFSFALPSSRSKVHLTSAAVNGLPSCHLTPWRRLKVSSVPSSLHDQPVARSGSIDLRLFCGSSCLYMTRLLKTPIIGTTAE